MGYFLNLGNEMICKCSSLLKLTSNYIIGRTWFFEFMKIEWCLRELKNIGDFEGLETDTQDLSGKISLSCLIHTCDIV